MIENGNEDYEEEANLGRGVAMRTLVTKVAVLFYEPVDCSFSKKIQI